MSQRKRRETRSNRGQIGGSRTQLAKGQNENKKGNSMKIRKNTEAQDHRLTLVMVRGWSKLSSCVPKSGG